MGLINIGHWPGGNTQQDEADDEARARLDAIRAERLEKLKQKQRAKDAGAEEKP